MIITGTTFGEYKPEPASTRFLKGAGDKDICVVVAKKRGGHGRGMETKNRLMNHEKSLFNDSDLAAIREVICQSCNIHIDEFMSIKRGDKQVNARCIFTYVVKKLDTVCSYERIGAMIRRNHSVTIHLYRLFDAYSKDMEFQKSHNECVVAISKMGICAKLAVGELAITIKNKNPITQI